MAMTMTTARTKWTMKFGKNKKEETYTRGNEGGKDAGDAGNNEAHCKQINLKYKIQI